MTKGNKRAGLSALATASAGVLAAYSAWVPQARAADEGTLAQQDGPVAVSLGDSFISGGHGSGLVGLRDRVEALGGHLWLHSPPGAGTTLQAQLAVGQARPSAAGGAGPGAAHSAQAVPPRSRSH
jgi:hypothetical protein